MKITAQEEYGLRCLVQLARAPYNQIVSVKEVAAQEGLSSAYVEKLLRILSKTGLVHSVRGVKGGYVMSRPASAITLGDVVRALGTLETTDHICESFTGNGTVCVHFSNCGIRSAWSGLTSSIHQFLDQTTLESLLGDEYAVPHRLDKRVGKQGLS